MPAVVLERHICADYDAAHAREWLCANGIGGYASGTVGGALTRRYHGVLVAALKPPLGRTMLVAKLDEVVVAGEQAWPLSTNRWASGVVDAEGYRSIARFELEGSIPTWVYEFDSVRVSKRVWMEHGANTTYVQYELLGAGAAARVGLRCKAIVDRRDFHHVSTATDRQIVIDIVKDGARIAFDGAEPTYLRATSGTFQPDGEWYRDYDLARERERGLEDREDLVCAGTFDAELRPGEPWTIVLSVDADPPPDGPAALAKRRARDQSLASNAKASQPGWITQLRLAADAFVVRRPVRHDAAAHSLIAGYHWFGDWGRDAMIALPGLLLGNGREQFAARILRTFARFVDGGMLPNYFPDEGETPAYNSVDASLWCFEAVRRYFAATHDYALVDDLHPVLAQIADAYRRGARYGIHVDPADGLLSAGQRGVQLTWMDAKVGDWVVTPRTGKCVEVNALWCSALATMTDIAARRGTDAPSWRALADAARRGFERFWNPALGYCYDVIDGPDGDDPSLRPNQLFAVALPIDVLDADKRRRIVEVCRQELMTPAGLRTLSPRDHRYVGRYEGPPAQRDASYHQGTVWPWLLGAFADAHFRVYGDAAAALAFFDGVGERIATYGVGSVAEICDGDAPHAPRGCVAQAWSVAEALRVYDELAG